MTQSQAARREAMQARLGERIAGRFRLTRVLGAGGMGVVYLAIQEPLGRPVALKVLVHERQTESFRQRFFLEASVAARLSSPHIVTIHDYGETAHGELYIAMEYVEGVALGALLKREGPFAPVRICRLIRQVCKGLSVAHDAGVVHRDLKPSNIMLMTDRDGEESVKVLDFGLVKSFVEEAIDGELTGAGMVLGSPSYMSPEQIRRTAVDQRTDIYAIGVLIYRLLTGRPPFQAETVVEVMNLHLNGMPLSIDTYLPHPDWIQRQLEAVAMRCLQKNPTLRYGSMDELKEAIKAIERLIPPDPGAPPRRISSTDSRASDSYRSVSSEPSSLPAVGPGPIDPHAPDDLPTMTHSAFLSISSIEALGPNVAAPTIASVDAVPDSPLPQTRPGFVGPEVSGPDSLGADGQRSASQPSSLSNPSISGSRVPGASLASVSNAALATSSGLRQPDEGLSATWPRWAAGVAVVGLVGVGVALLAGRSETEGPEAQKASNTVEASAEGVIPTLVAPSTRVVAADAPEAAANDAAPPTPARVNAPAPTKTSPPSKPVAAPRRRPVKVMLTLVSDPAGAEVKLGSEVLGLTPLTTSVPRVGQVRTLVFRLDGYRKVQREFSDDAGAIDITVRLTKKASRRPKKAKAEPGRAAEPPPPKRAVEARPEPPPPPANPLRRKLKANPYD